MDSGARSAFRISWCPWCLCGELAMTNCSSDEQRRANIQNAQSPSAPVRPLSFSAFRIQHASFPKPHGLIEHTLLERIATAYWSLRRCKVPGHDTPPQTTPRPPPPRRRLVAILVPHAPAFRLAHVGFASRWLAAPSLVFWASPRSVAVTLARFTPVAGPLNRPLTIDNRQSPGCHHVSLSGKRNYRTCETNPFDA